MIVTVFNTNQKLKKFQRCEWSSSQIKGFQKKIQFDEGKNQNNDRFKKSINRKEFFQVVLLLLLLLHIT